MESNNMKPTNKIHNVETGEVIEVEMTDEEYAIYLENKAAEQQRDLEAQNKAEAKAQAEVKLAALGLTSDDLKALGL